MIERLLIANRGEIARRIMRTCRDSGIETVAVFSDADAGAAFVQDADRAVAIGGQTPAASYLRVDAILEAARRTGADAVHPGYGFLAENAAFAQAVTEAGLTFVGPTADVIAVMGSKLAAKERMAAAGVPLLPSIELTGLEAAAVESAAADLGFPLLIKASAGGGGRGMRIVSDAGELLEAVEGAAREAASAFGDATIYAERYVSPSRHVEVQIFGDTAGTVVHFHERECSIQRRHQKIIEEAPSPSLDPDTRAALHAAAVRAGEAIGYTNAGTVEFLLAPQTDRAPAAFYFLEVNTRLQVEHPVTEAVLGVDLVELQLHVAQGGTVPPQETIGPLAGHAIEARLYAEDPAAEFRPSTGPVHRFVVPGDVRLDTALEPTTHAHAQVGEVSQYYDPMIAKVIAHAPNRRLAARRLAGALARSAIDGIVTNRELLVRTLRHADFLGDAGDSSFFERNDPAELAAPLVAGDALAGHAAAAALALQATHRLADTHTPMVASGFRNVVTQPQRTSFDMQGRHLEVDHLFRRGVLDLLEVDGQRLESPVAYSVTPDRVDLGIEGVRIGYDVGIQGHHISVTGPDASVSFSLLPRFAEPGEQTDPGSTVASMPGTVVAVHVAEGDTVAAGDTLVVMEAMKMELAITAASAGVVTEVAVDVGQAVEAGAVLAVVDATGVN